MNLKLRTPNLIRNKKHSFPFFPGVSDLWASLVAQLVKNLPAMWRPGFNPWVWNIPWRRERLPTPVFSPGEFHGLYSPQGHNWTWPSDFH